ncbi:TetR/AcrR family transcriptional regulator [Streptomyces sp. NPDC047028]|uniref:TetR/AcrR family transcriptional regulator n=1 Tax=Streptomyces sp. NPDC047028 TaxID=3155793 RepID=UPI0033E4CA8C
MRDETPGARDGRLERGRLTRVKIADAVLSLLDEGESHLPADKVAERAGVSRRLVFHHFDDMPQLVDAAVTQRLGQLSDQMKPLPHTGPREKRITALVEQRARILEWLTPARLAVMRIDPPSERIEEATRAILDLARLNLAKAFALELDTVTEPRRAQLIDAMHTATTWGAWYHWRMMGMDAAEARTAMESILRILLETTDANASGRQ